MVLVAAGIVAGVWAVWSAVRNVWVPIAIAGFAVVATIPKLARGSLLLLCAAVVATLALVGFNVFLGLFMGWLPDGVVEWLPDWIADHRGHLEIKLGLALALVVFASAAYFYLRGTWLRAVPAGWRPPRLLHWFDIPTPKLPWWGSLAVAATLAVVVVLGVPRLLSEVEERLEDPPAAVPVKARLRADIDIAIVADRRHAEARELARNRARGGFVKAYAEAVDLDVRYTIALAQGTDLVWTRTGVTDAAQARALMAATLGADARAPDRREGAGAVVVLMVDGTPPVVEEPEALEDVLGRPGEVERWATIASQARVGPWEGTPVYALLQTTDELRLQEWHRTFDELGGVVSVQELGSQTVTDAAVRLAVGTSDAHETFWLAMRYRPILLFDRGETVPRPLSIERLFERKLVRQCVDLESGGTCGRTAPVTTVAELRSPGRHLVISRPPEELDDLADREHEAWLEGKTTLDAPSAPSAFALQAAGAPPPGTPPATPPTQVAPSERLLGEDSRIYVHPVLVRQGRRRLLHLDYWWYLHDNPAGAVKGAFCGAGLVIVGVTCFDHESDWEGLTVVLERTAEEWNPVAVYYAQHESVVRYEWDDLRAHWTGREGLPAEIRRRLPDNAERPIAFIARGTHASYARRCDGGCRQVAKNIEENDHDGGLPWVGNDTAACLRVACMIPLPVAAGGGGPASWNAFEGPWGRRRCVWTYYCDSGTPPAAPGRQERYRNPKRFDGRADVDDPESFTEGG